MTDSYDITGILPAGTVETLPAGTNLLVMGPPMVGKRELALRLLAAGHEASDGVLCITTSNTAASLLEEFKRQVPNFDRDRVAMVDCSGSDDRRTIEAIATERVSSPGDLTGISIGTAKLLQLFSEQDVDSVRHGLVSVSTLLQYLDLNTVFKFLHIYTSRIEDTAGLGIFTLDNTSHDAQATNTVTSEFDYVLELRETASGGRELRCKGFPGTSREWHPLD